MLDRNEYSVCLTVLPWLRIATGQFDQAGIGLHFLVAANGDIDGDQTIVARGIVECDRLMPDRPLGRGEIPDGNQHGE